ncbi:MAG TPA: hypothetical protein VGQ59_00690 [Cyclobacteriaceae bacterium]|nr:hypothetical protein [Cyclobacteriaceae bacterium]
MKWRFNILFSVFILGSCAIGGGTLGGFPPIYFPTSKVNLEHAMDSLFLKYPQYSIPEKWKEKDNWSQRGYDFLESRIFYFKNDPEELYYVTFIGDQVMLRDTTKVSIAIRAVDSESKTWQKYDELNDQQRSRIERRFHNEIIKKLETFSKCKSKETE